MFENSHIIKNNQHKTERILGICAILCIILAWFIGKGINETNLSEYLHLAVPEADHFEPGAGNTYTAFKNNGESDDIVGYLAAGEANGYGGPMVVLAAVDLDGNISGFTIVEQRETLSFLRRILNSDLFKSLSGRNIGDELSIGVDIDAVSGATVSSKALVESLKKAGREAAIHNLSFEPLPEQSKNIVFGFREIALIALFVLGFIGHTRTFKYKKQIRLLSMISGMIILGFMYNSPVTISKLNSFLLGYWPDWHFNLYWYILIGGIIFVYTLDNKNPYCQWFCPFGAAQECIGMIGGAKARTPVNWRYFFRWFQRALAWMAVMLALLFRNPGVSSYEIFGVLFELNGTTITFILLGLILTSSLFIKRPWCNYLCPVAPVTDLLRLLRNWIKELWKTKTREKTI